MKIGIIIHSQTGHTLSVAERMQQILMAVGHSVAIDRVVATNDEEPKPEQVTLESAPDYAQYEALILGAPVRGFALSPVMTAYLSTIPTFSDKRIECFVTEYFPFPSMGGNQAIRQMRAICEEKGGEVVGTGVINWSNPKRDRQIDQLVDKQPVLFPNPSSPV